MNVKISVKKLYRMEQMWKQRCEANGRRYQREVEGWEKENKWLKDKVERLNKVEEIQDDRDFLNHDIEGLNQQLDAANARNYRLLAESEANEKLVRHLNDRMGSYVAENERLKNLFEDKVQSHLQQLAEINELKLEVESLKKDRNDWEDAARSAADNL
jgi:chromosome segregation ATPase